MPCGSNNKMTFKEALAIANQKSNLVGTVNSEGATLDEIIIAPSNPTEFAQFEKLYNETLDAQKSIVPFMQSDLIVLGVFDKYRIRKENIILVSEV